MYKCELCLYSTDRQSNLIRHCNTKRHIIRVNHETNCINKISDTNLENCTLDSNTDDEDNLQDSDKSNQKIYKCEQCDKIYKARQNLWRHKSTTVCGTIITKKESEPTEKTELIELKEQVKQMSDIINKFIENTTSGSNAIANIGRDNISNNNKTIIFNYVNNNYQNTPPLQKITNTKISKLLTVKNTNHTIEEFIVFHYRKYNLHAFFGEIITKEYKKQNPEEQQIWTSSQIHLTFIVRQILNKEKRWLKDMNGVCIIRYVIDPILSEVKKILQDFCKSLEHITKNENVSLTEIERLQQNGITSIEIIKDINNKILHKQILKYIAPEFQINGEVDLIEYTEEKIPKKIYKKNEK